MGGGAVNKEGHDEGNKNIQDIFAQNKTKKLVEALQMTLWNGYLALPHSFTLQKLQFLRDCFFDRCFFFFFFRRIMEDSGLFSSFSDLNNYKIMHKNSDSQ